MPQLSGILQYLSANARDLKEAEFCAQLVEAFKADAASIWLLDKCSHILKLHVSTDITDPATIRRINKQGLERGLGVSGTALLERRPLIYPDDHTNSKHEDFVDELVGEKTQAMASAPILLNDQHPVGVLNLIRKEITNHFTSQDANALGAIARMYAVCLDAVGKYPRLDHKPTTEEGQADFIVTSPAMKEIQEDARLLAPLDYPILLLGESGTGKSAFAREIHKYSRRKGNFIHVNCGGLTDQLVRDELFGHVRGAFDGAVKDRTGAFLEAADGTLFLDEIADLPMVVQPMVFTALNEKIGKQLGSETPQRYSFRLIAATNLDLEKLIEERKFRRELKNRIRHNITIPPLRERQEDIVPLLRHFARTIQDKNKITMPQLTPDAEEVLTNKYWPQNVQGPLAFAEELALYASRRNSKHHLDASDVEQIYERIRQHEPPAAPSISRASQEQDRFVTTASIPQALQEKYRKACEDPKNQTDNGKIIQVKIGEAVGLHRKTVKEHLVMLGYLEPTARQTRRK